MSYCAYKSTFSSSKLILLSNDNLLLSKISFLGYHKILIIDGYTLNSILTFKIEMYV